MTPGRGIYYQTRIMFFVFIVKSLFDNYLIDFPLYSLDLSSPVLEMCSPLETPPETPEVKDQCADTDATQPQPSEGDDSQDLDQTLIDLFIKTLGDKYVFDPRH